MLTLDVLNLLLHHVSEFTFTETVAEEDNLSGHQSVLLVEVKEHF